MNHWKALALAAALAAVPAFGQQFNPAGWNEARPVTTVAASRTSQAGVYRVSLSITDAESAKVLGKPILQTKAGAPGTIEIGSRTGVMVRSVVTVDGAGRAVSYRTEVLKAGVVQSAHTGTAPVQDEV